MVTDMNVSSAEPDWEYRTLLIIWSALMAMPPLMLLCVYLIDSSVADLDLSQPFVGERYILVPAAVLLTLLDLFLAYYRHKTYLRSAVIEKNTEFVQTALIIAGANTASLSTYGFFLWWLFSYPYFWLWMLVDFVATLCLYPRRSVLLAARGI